MERDADAVYEVIDSISTTYVPDRNELLQKLYTNNVNILEAQKQVDMPDCLCGICGIPLPRINFTAGYNLSLVDNTASNVLY